MPKKPNNDWLKKLLNPSINLPDKDVFKPPKEDKRTIGKKIESLLISGRGIKIL